MGGDAGIVVDAFAAAATTAAVVAAFVIQRRQARDDRALTESSRANLRFCAAFAALEALSVTRRARDWARGIGNSNAFAESEKLRWSSESIDYYMTQEIADPLLVRAVVQVRSIVAETRKDADELAARGIDLEPSDKVRFAQQIEAKATAIASIEKILEGLSDGYLLQIGDRDSGWAHAASLAAKTASDGR